MLDMQEEVNQYYQSVRIAPVYNTGCFDEMFSEFNCCKKDACRDACYVSFELSRKRYLFASHSITQSDKVSQCYIDRKY